MARLWPWLAAGAFVCLAGIGVTARAVQVAVTRPLAPRSATAHLVVVLSGMRLRQIGQLLQADGIVRFGWGFDLWALAHDDQRRLEAGTYRLGPWMTIPQIATMLTSGDIATASVTIPEGWDVDQVIAALERAGLGTAAALTSAADDPSLLQGLGIQASSRARYPLEGFLFPDTYSFPVGSSPDAMFGRMTAQFSQEWTSDLQSAATSEGLNTLQAVTLASIVQREVTDPGQMQAVAGIYLNRLRQGMDLDADPTVLYGLGLTSWQGPLGSTQLASSSPYNTYAHTGLPPGPICNPGAAALTAVAHPATLTALYFLSAPDGQLVVADTYAEQLANQQKYLGY